MLIITEELSILVDKKYFDVKKHKINLNNSSGKEKNTKVLHNNLSKIEPKQYMIGRNNDANLEILDKPKINISRYVSHFNGILDLYDKKNIFYQHLGRNPASFSYNKHNNIETKEIYNGEKIKLMPSNTINVLSKYPNALRIYLRDF